MNKISISAVISVFNGEETLGDCLSSVSFADEIVVVNNSSTDKTLEIAKKYTDSVFTRLNDPMLNISKNFGFSKAKGEWILSLDADERVSEELKDEIKNVINNKTTRICHSGEERTDDSRIPKHDERFWASQNDDKNINGYWIPRKNIVFGEWIEHTGWYPDHQLRLFRKGFGKFEEKHVHEMVKIVGKAEYLKHNLIHYNYISISQFLQKLQIYAPNEAKNLIEGGYKFKWQDAIGFPVKEFLSRFFARAGYKDGFHGLMLSIFMAFYHFVVFANIWEKRGFEKIEKNLIDETAAEFKKSYRDIIFWIGNERLKTIKNPLEKIVYKIVRKIRGS